METKTVANVTDAALNLAHLKHEVSKAKVLIDEVLDDTKRQASRMMKRGIVAAEDYVEDTTYVIKRHPWQSVGAAFGLGTGLGILAGWLAMRTFTRNRQG